MFKLFLTNDQQVKLLQAAIYATAFVGLIFFWDLTLFLYSLLTGWCLYALGGSLGLHKLASHRTFEPKNKFAKHLILFAATINSLGSTISWAANHRKHHRHTDKEGDPHCPTGNLWTKIKLWFYYFPVYHINPRIIKDLTIDKEHKWYHSNYFKVIFAYIIVLSLINPVYVIYFYAIPAIYCFWGMSWATVPAHSKRLAPWCYRNYDTDERSHNSHLVNLLVPGEGYHNNHHANPWLWNNAVQPWEFDITAPLIRLLGIPNDIPPRTINPGEKVASC